MHEDPGGTDELSGVLEILSEQECLALLAGQRVGRVGVTIGAMPAILPVNYSMLDRRIVFRTAEGTKLQAALVNAVVAFQVDEVDDAAFGGWSVLVVGVASELAGDERHRALALPLVSWAPAGREHVVAVTPDFVSGRRLVPGPF